MLLDFRSLQVNQRQLAADGESYAVSGGDASFTTQREFLADGATFRFAGGSSTVDVVAVIHVGGGAAPAGGRRKKPKREIDPYAPQRPVLVDAPAAWRPEAVIAAEGAQLTLIGGGAMFTTQRVAANDGAHIALQGGDALFVTDDTIRYDNELLLLVA